MTTDREGVYPVTPPQPVIPPQPIPELEEEEEEDELAGVFEVTDEDVMGDESAAPPEAEITEEDEEEMFGASFEDIMGYNPKPKQPKIRRTTKQYPPPPTTLGGMR